MSKNKIRNTNSLKHEVNSLASEKKSPKLKSSRFNVVSKLSTLIFGAGFLEDKKNTPVLRYLIFLCLLFMIYIFYGYRSEKQIRKANKLEKEVNELRSEFIFSTGELMFLKKQSNLSEEVKKLGLKASTTPPFIIKTSSQNLERDE
jgi:Ca2+/Na+ antiporter